MFYDISIKFNHDVIQKSNLITLHKSVQLIQKNIIETRQKTIWYSPYNIPLFVNTVDLSKYGGLIMDTDSYHFNSINILNLIFCGYFGINSYDIRKLTNLKLLDLTSCNHPYIKSSDIKYLINLTSLNLENCDQLEMKSSDIKHLINLKSLNICGCYQPEMKLEDICKLVNLTSLKMSYIRNSYDMNQLINLNSLIIYDCKIKSSDICELINLKTLDLMGCKQHEMKSDDM